MMKDWLSGDIILYPIVPSSRRLDRAIGMAQRLMGYVGKQYCHCAIYDDDGYDYEARWPRVGYYRVDMKSPFEIYRIVGITELQRQLMIFYAATHAGEPYDVWALLTAGIVQKKQEEVCSQLVAESLRYAKLIASGTRFEKPDDIRGLVPMLLIDKGGVQ
jgi:hypothetical protein